MTAINGGTSTVGPWSGPPANYAANKQIEDQCQNGTKNTEYTKFTKFTCVSELKITK